MGVNERGKGKSDEDERVEMGGGSIRAGEGVKKASRVDKARTEQKTGREGRKGVEERGEKER